MQGNEKVNTVARSAGVVLDLNALLAARALEPVEVHIGDEVFHVNTDLTGKETAQALALFQQSEDAAGITLLLGTREERAAMMAALAQRAEVAQARLNAERQLAQGQTPLRSGRSSKAPKVQELPVTETARRLNDLLDAMPRLHMQLAMSAIFRASRVMAEYAKADEEILAKHGFGEEEQGKS